MTAAWVLVLDAPSGDARRRVGGLPLALRLALDAQAGGAAAIVAAADAPFRSDLDDPRLKLPLCSERDAGALAVSIAANTVIHRQLLGRLAKSGQLPLPPATRALKDEPFGSPDVPFGFEPIEVVDDESAKRAERALFRALRKPQDGWTSTHLNRHVSLAISRQLVRTPLRPNQLSLAILAIGLLGAWLASRGGYAAIAIGATLFQLQSILDGCDGEMSRVTYRGSLLGEWLDTVGDDLTNYGFFAGAALGLYRDGGQLAYLVAGAVTVGCGLLASGLEYRYLIRIGSGDLLKYPLSAASASGDGSLFGRIAPLFKRDTFVFVTWVLACLGVVGPMLFVFAAGAVGVLIGVLATERRLAHERHARPGG